jgi:hypothetical protein
VDAITGNFLYDCDLSAPKFQEIKREQRLLANSPAFRALIREHEFATASDDPAGGPLQRSLVAASDSPLKEFLAHQTCVVKASTLQAAPKIT